MSTRALSRLLIIVLTLVFLSACGGGGGSSSGTEPVDIGIDTDRDSDGIENDADNCPDTANANQSDLDDDGIGDACEADTDEDGVIDDVDQCPETDPGLDTDANGCADNQLDTDGDGVTNDLDNCPATPEDTPVQPDGCPTGEDSDGDGIGDAQDVCPNSVLVDSEGNDFEFFISGCPKVVSDRDGISYDVYLASNVDGERIAFTVHEARSVSATKKTPIIGEGHGYGLTRISARPAANSDTTSPGTGAPNLIGLLLDANYGAFSMDQRGHGESGGQIRLLDPDVEGQDIVQIVDWLGNNISWLDFSEGGNDYLLGGIGSSYGGGFQHTLLRIDPLNRLDAMVPDITWYDLRYSINTNNVFKSKWALLLSALGNATPGGHDPQVNQGLQDGLLTNNVGDEEAAILYRSSMAYSCDGDNPDDFAGRPLTPIPTLYTQGPSDTLFDLTETYNNYQCLRDIDPAMDIRLFTQPYSHDDLVGMRECGGLSAGDVMVAFFDRHLKDVTDALDGVPEICINLDGVSVQRTAAEGFPVGNVGNAANTFTANTSSPFVFSELLGSTANIDVYTATTDNEIIAGIPTIQLAVERSVASAAIPDDGIVFVGIAIKRSGTTSYVLPNQSLTGTGQVTPFRDTELVAGEVRQLSGITATLMAGDVVAVQYKSSDPTYLTSGTLTPGIIGDISATVHLPILGGRGVVVQPFPLP